MIDGRLKHFALNYADDDNLWWQLEDGEQKNLFDAALEEIAALREQGRQWQSVVEVYKKALAACRANQSSVEVFNG